MPGQECPHGWITNKAYWATSPRPTPSGALKSHGPLCHCTYTDTVVGQIHNLRDTLVRPFVLEVVYMARYPTTLGCYLLNENSDTVNSASQTHYCLNKLT